VILQKFGAFLELILRKLDVDRFSEKVVNSTTKIVDSTKKLRKVPDIFCRGT
jgi:hypothetical protein